MFYNGPQESDFYVPTHQDIIREQARQLGAQKPDRCWILTDYDTWERNPFYTGPEQPHPEDD
tara:strand:- start:52 stop:237 length:186 start_codon:yes stop_codon:yes gene_type:complete